MGYRDDDWRELVTKFDNGCVGCWKPIPWATRAWFNVATKQWRCLKCPPTEVAVDALMALFQKRTT